jgi:hypothetical protein
MARMQFYFNGDSNMTFDSGQIAAFAIQKIKPDSEFGIGSTYGSLNWLDKTQTKPTEKEFDDAVTAWNAEWTAQEYARNRASEYPSVQECVHAILDDQLDALQAKRAEIKTKYPKGG